jgi:hypothetical protein
MKYVNDNEKVADIVRNKGSKSGGVSNWIYEL